MCYPRVPQPTQTGPSDPLTYFILYYNVTFSSQLLPAGCLLHRNFCALRRGWLCAPGDLPGWLGKKISCVCLGQITEQLCFSVCSGNITSVGWDCLHLCSQPCSGGCFNGKPSLKPCLAAAQTSPHSLLLYSFDLFPIARKQPICFLPPTGSPQAHSSTFQV